MFGWIKGIFAGKASAQPRAVRVVRGRYDAATVTDENRRHWANADGLSANAANSPEVRRRLRNNARYEVANNSYARGIVLTLANDSIGTGPRLQMLTEDPEVNRRVETAFSTWARAVGLPEKLQAMRMAKAEDGEAFALLTTNPSLPTPIKLDLAPLEADQVTTPFFRSMNGRAVDGIVFDASGNPVEYHVLKKHPGDGDFLPPEAFDRVPAAAMIHYFRADRPGQARGIPEITPALPLFAQLRRYTLAVIAAAEAAADMALVIYTDAPANGEADSLEPMDVIELERRMATVMPGGWKLGQTHAEQPATTYAEFKHEILNEIARCLNMPFNIAAGNSSGYNYASGRLDHQTYFKSIRVEQTHIEAVVLDRILAAWLAEASSIEGFLTELPPRVAHQWFWDGMEHVDPAKEANAQETRLRNHTTTLAEEYGRRGRDWEVELRQRAKEAALMRELGLSVAAPGATPPKDEEEEDDGAAHSGNGRGSRALFAAMYGRPNHDQRIS
jgi:lambda family phage portal protein